MATRTSWAVDLLVGLGDTPNLGNLTGVVAWELTEGGWFDNPDQYNPLNTTLPKPGSIATNSAGVQSYPDYATGLEATVQTLTNGLYGPILAALAGDSASAIARTVTASRWGTGPISPAVVAQAQVEVQQEWTPPAPPPPPAPPAPLEGPEMLDPNDPVIVALNARLDALEGNVNTHVGFTQGYRPRPAPGAPVWDPHGGLLGGQAVPGVRADDPPPVGSIGPAGFTWAVGNETASGSFASYQATDGQQYWTYQQAP